MENISKNDSDDDESFSDTYNSDSDNEMDLKMKDTSESDMDQEMEEQNIETNKEFDDDEVVKAFIREQNKKRDHPPDISFEDHVINICFHPVEDLIAVASVTGDVFLCKYTDEETAQVDTWELHTKACRDIKFTSDGKLMVSTGKDKCIMLTDVNTGKLIKFYENCHTVPVYSLCVIENNLLISGDDNGTIKLWDFRNNDSKPIYQCKKHEDYISDIVCNESKKFIISSSGDGSISAIDFQSRQFFLQSEKYDEEFTSLGIYRSETKVLTSTSKGKLFLFNWGEFGYHSDEFPGPKQSINTTVPITENIVVTAMEDGQLRATHLFPHRHLGIVGQHTMPVECLDISNDGHLIASCSHNNDIKFWNIQYFETFDKVNPRVKHNKKDLSNNLPSSKRKNLTDFFRDLS